MIVLVTYKDSYEPFAVQAEIALIPSKADREALVCEGRILLQDEAGFFYLRTEDVIYIQPLMLN